MNNETPPQLHQSSAGHHEQAAIHHLEAAGYRSSGNSPAASHHARMALGHALHATLPWIDHKSLPHTQGAVAKFFYDQHGAVDGFFLDTGHQIHFTPSMSDDLLKAVKLGDKVKVHGVKVRAFDLMVAASITAANGIEIVNLGPDANL
jgi:hypothetical protein